MFVRVASDWRREPVLVELEAGRRYCIVYPCAIGSSPRQVPLRHATFVRLDLPHARGADPELVFRTAGGRLWRRSTELPASITPED